MHWATETDRNKFETRAHRIQYEKYFTFPIAEAKKKTLGKCAVGICTLSRKIKFLDNDE